MTWPCRPCGADNPSGTRFCGQCGAPAASVMLDDTPANRLPEQRRFATAVFADLSGFTDLAERLDAETLSEVIGDVIRGLAEVVERFGGTVLNYAGDAILAGWGIPHSAGDDAERAVAAALDMRRALTALQPGLPPEAAGLTLHIGINSGHAIARYAGASSHVAYTVLGDAVNLAQRIEASTPAGQIHLGPATAALVAGTFDLEEQPPVSVKGRAAPVSTFRVLGRSVATLGRGRTHGVSMTVVGRADVLAAIETTASSARVTAIVGEAGIGKSTIVREMMHRLSSVRWTVGVATPYEPTPYGIWRPIIRDLLGHDEQIFGAADDDAASDEGDLGTFEARRRRVHAAVINAIRDAAPVVVVLDDLQWADAASNELAGDVAEMVQRCGGGPVTSMVVTSRPEGVEAVDMLLAQLPAELGDVIHLDGLDPSETSQLLEAILGGPASLELSDLVLERTGGSPLFATELTRLFHERGDIAVLDGVWHLVGDQAGAGVPPTVEELVQGLLDRLAPRPRMVLEVASVIGTPLRLDLLRAATGGLDLDAELAALVESGVLVGDPSGPAQLSFRHGLVRDVAYGATLRAVRRRLHGDVAASLVTMPGDPAERLVEVAQHLHLADAGEPAVHALDRAARHAAALFANTSALRLLDTAIGDSVRHGLEAVRIDALRLRRASLCSLLGRFDDALDGFLELLAHHGLDGHLRLAAMGGAASAYRSTGRFDEAIALLHAADQISTEGEHERAVVRASVLGAAGRLAEAVAECDRVLGEPVTPRVHAGLLLERAQAYDRLGRASDALADAEAADRLVPPSDVGLRVRVLRILGGMYIDQERLDEAERTLIDGSRLATTGGVTWELVGCNVNLSFVRQQRGDLAAAIELDRQSVRELHRIRHSFEGGALANLSHKLIDAGQLVEAAEVADRAEAAALDAGDRWALADARYAIGRAAGRRGRRSTALPALRASLDLLRELGTASMLDDVERELERWSAVELPGADDLDAAAGEHHVR